MMVAGNLQNKCCFIQLCVVPTCDAHIQHLAVLEDNGAAEHSATGSHSYRAAAKHTGQHDQDRSFEAALHCSQATVS